MNTEPPKSIDEIIAKFLDFADHIAENKTSDPKSVCQLGWLVLKIRESRADKPDAQKPPGLSPETIRQIEQAAKLL